VNRFEFLRLVPDSPGKICSVVVCLFMWNTDPRVNSRNYIISIRMLYSLALVCKIFHEPAHNALWRFQQLFVTLVKMFSEDVWFETEDPTVAVSPLSQYQ
jgi:hypothetical protein